MCQDGPDLLVVAEAVIGPGFAPDTFEGHAQSFGDGDAAVVVGAAVPFGAVEAARLQGPVDDDAAGVGDQAAALRFRGRPAADFAHAFGGVEVGEHDSADEAAVIKDAVQSAGVGCLPVGVASEGVAGPVNVVGDERGAHPGPDVFTNVVHVGGELFGVPYRQWAQLRVVFQLQ